MIIWPHAGHSINHLVSFSLFLGQLLDDSTRLQLSSINILYYNLVSLHNFL